MQKLIENLSMQPIVCIVLSGFFFLFAYFMNYLLLDSLLKMHRSKSALKKLKKEYTFLQRMLLAHFKGNCRHAVKFCNSLVFFQKTGLVCFTIYLLVSFLFAFDLFSSAFISWLSIVLFMVIDLPSFAINWALSRPLFFGRFKEHSFEKYHNTDNHESLF